MKKLLLILLAILLLAGCTSRPVVVKEEDDVVEQEKVEFTIGKTEGFEYENEFFNIKLVLDDKWYISSEEELKQLQQTTLDVLDKDYLQEAFDNNQAVFVFSAETLFETNLEKYSNIVIVVEGLPLSNLKVEQVIKNSLDATKETFEQQGAVVESIEMADIQVKDHVEKGVKTHLNISGMDAYQTQIFIVKDKYCLTFGITTFSEEYTNELLNNISFVK